MNSKQGTLTGTVADTYATVLTLYVADYEKILIHIKNTNGASLTLDYKVFGYALNGGDLYEEIPGETILAAAATDSIKIANTAYATLVIQMQKNTTAATYAIEYCLKR